MFITFLRRLDREYPKFPTIEESNEYFRIHRNLREEEIGYRIFNITMLTCCYTVREMVDLFMKYREAFDYADFENEFGCPVLDLGRIDSIDERREGLVEIFEGLYAKYVDKIEVEFF